MGILVVGSVALDSVETPFGKRDNILGGSATFFSFSASFFNKVDMVAVVGSDFPQNALDLFRKRRIGIDGLEKADGNTFRWKGKYDFDLNTAHTIYTHLNVFERFKPVIPEHLRKSDYVFLANIDPELQHSVLKQIKKPKLIACDSMNFWISTKKKAFERLLKHIDIMLLNDAEARQFSGESNLFKAARHILSYGPKAVVIKKGEHGVIYFSRKSHFIAPAYLLETLYDPTGAGDTFAGGMMGYLSRCKSIDERAIRKSLIYGSVMASFAVEDFSVGRLARLTKREIEARYRHFRFITKF